METNEMMVNNEEVIEEVTEEIVTKKSGKGVKIAAGVGLALIIGGLAIKYVILPAAAKRKAKKQDSDVIDGDFEDLFEEITEDSEESKDESEEK